MEALSLAVQLIEALSSCDDKSAGVEVGDLIWDSGFSHKALGRFVMVVGVAIVFISLGERCF